MLCHAAKHTCISSRNTVIQIGLWQFHLKCNKKRQVNGAHSPQKIRKDKLTVLQIITICYCMKKILTHQYIIERNIIFLKKIKQYIPLNILIQYQASKCLILFFFQSLPAPMLFTPIHILKIQFINFGNIFWQLICIFASQRAICRNRQNDKLCIGK